MALDPRSPELGADVKTWIWPRSETQAAEGACHDVSHALGEEPGSKITSTAEETHCIQYLVLGLILSFLVFNLLLVLRFHVYFMTS